MGIIVFIIVFSMVILKEMETVDIIILGVSCIMFAPGYFTLTSVLWNGFKEEILSVRRK